MTRGLAPFFGLVLMWLQAWQWGQCKKAATESHQNDIGGCAADLGAPYVADAQQKS